MQSTKHGIDVLGWQVFGVPCGCHAMKRDSELMHIARFCRDELAQRVGAPTLQGRVGIRA